MDRKSSCKVPVVNFIVRGGIVCRGLSGLRSVRQSSTSAMSGLFGRTGTGAPQKGQLVCANPALDGGRAGTARGQTRKENTDKPQPHLAARLARLDIIDGLDKCRGGSSDAEQAGASTVSPRNSSPTRTAHSSSRRVLLTNDTPLSFAALLH